MVSLIALRLAVVVLGAYGINYITAVESDKKERRRNIAIVVVFTLLMFFFGADILALLINSLRVQY